MRGSHIGTRHSIISKEKNKQYQAKYVALGIAARKLGGSYLRGFDGASGAAGFVLGRLSDNKKTIILAEVAKSGTVVDGPGVLIGGLLPPRRIILHRRGSSEKGNHGGGIRFIAGGEQHYDTQHNEDQDILAPIFGKAALVEENFVDIWARASKPIFGEHKPDPTLGDVFKGLNQVFFRAQEEQREHGVWPIMFFSTRRQLAPQLLDLARRHQISVLGLTTDDKLVAQQVLPQHKELLKYLS